MKNALKDKLGDIPRKPGVYIFKDKNGKILYIGKARVLRSRVRSYFHQKDPVPPKTASLVRRTNDLEWILTGSEVEALLAEANLVKEHQPKYNVNLKDDKSFPYIRITNEPYPQVLLTRKIVRDGSRYFGPYTEVKSLRETLKVIHKVFPIRSCNYYIDDRVIRKKKISVCLDYHIRKCQGPCEGLVSRGDYRRMIRSVTGFLCGKSDPVIRDLRAHMEKASREMRYEEAALYRDQLRAVESFSRRQRKVAASFDDKDVVAVAVQDDDACTVVLRLRHGRMVGREKVIMTGVDGEKLGRALSDFIRQFYLETDSVPGEIILEDRPDDEAPLSAWLKAKRGRGVALTVPRRGEKVRLLRLARQNARLLLEEYLRQKARRRELIPTMVARLQSDLRLAVPPRRIEAFDISNVQGAHPVGAMVCFVDGRARKSEHRKFKIKSVQGVDDFAMMREVVFRRYSRLKKEGGSYPDLILVDGGKGQLGMAVSALRELGLPYIPVAGLAKRLEEVYLPGHPDPQSIARSSPGLLLLRRIRDEAHRFAITFHRRRRTKAMTGSIFDDIRGVGPVTRNRLLTQFGSVEAVAEASVREIRDRTGVSSKVAREIVSAARSFHRSSGPAPGPGAGA